ncbi:50S ribosomal protein L11 methyltransferase [candidate division KSB1 bacterium]|nr:50S ribosomal protein L11 methyltransferase [candidate division KSB1 bacterium]
MAKPFRKWYVIHIDIPADSKGRIGRDVIINRCFELGSQGTESKDNTIVAYFENKSWNQTIFENIQTFCRELVNSGTLSMLPLIQLTQVDDENWVDNWKEHFKPVEAGKSLLVIPPWEKLASGEYGDRVKIVIDPGMAFGTGGHESTQLALAILENYLSSGMSVLDIGTGSGVLAIAAAKLGAELVVAIDIDADSIEAAKKNVRENGVNDKVSIDHRTIETAPTAEYDLIVANINRKIIIENCSKIAQMLPGERGGIFIASGIKVDEIEAVTDAFEPFDLTPVKRKTKNDWVALAFQKNR